MSQKKVAIGIDLGTTKCCVGVVRDGKVEILENERSRKTTPSCVAFTDTERLIGEDAQDQAMVNPTNTIFGVKRIIGRDPEDSNVTKATTEMPYRIGGNAGNTCINVTYKGVEEALLPQQVTAMLLTKMKDLAEHRLGCAVDGAVISVPASFSNAQRQATKDAATIAGLKVLALINEPTAAAIAYQASRKGEAEETIAVVDFGGSKLDVEIVSIANASVSVKGLSGTTDLGGNYVDEILMAHVQEKFREKFSKEPPEGVTVFERLRAACLKLKNSLSLLPRVQDQLDCFGDEFLLTISMSRAKYEDILSNRIQSSLKTHFDHALKISGMNIQTITRVVLVGGSTRIPLVPHEILKYYNGCILDRSVNTDEAVAHGAALYAALLGGDNTVAELAVNDMLTNSFCFGTQGCSDMQNIFCNHVIIPTTKKLTVKEKARCLRFELYEELSGRRNPHRLIGTLCLSDEFNTSVRLVTDIAFEIDRCGIFGVMIQLGPSSDPSYIFRDLVRNYSVRLHAESLQNCVTREQQFRQDEKEERDRVEAYTNLESCCFRLQDAVEKTDGRQLFPDLIELIKTEACETIDWLDTEEFVRKSDCRTKLRSLKKLELNLMEELKKQEKFEQERADAENSLKSLLSRVQAFLFDSNVSDEEEKAAIVREQLSLVDKWFQLGTVRSKPDCDEKRVALDNAVGILERALEVRRREKERKASVINLQKHCSDLVESVTKLPLVEADLQLVTELIDQAKDILQWLESNDKSASIEECIKMKNSLEEKIKIQQRRAEQREQERAAEHEKEREKLVTSVWNCCNNLCARIQVSSIGMNDAALHKFILGQVAEVLAWHKKAGKNMSKTECEEALELLSNLDGLFSVWVKDREEKVLYQKREKALAEAAAKRELEQAEAAKKMKKEQAEATIKEKIEAEAARKVEREQAEAAEEMNMKQAEDSKKKKEQAEAKERNMKQAEDAKKIETEQAEAAKILEKEQVKNAKKNDKEQAETVEKQTKKQAEDAKRLEKEKSSSAKELEKRRTDALQSFEHKWANLEATLSMDVLMKVDPDKVKQAKQCAEQTYHWLNTPGSFSPSQYKNRLDTLKKLGKDLQTIDQQVRANNTNVDGVDSDMVMIDAENEPETEHDTSFCLLM